MCKDCATDPLHSAIFQGDVDAVREAVLQSQMVNHRSPCGKTPLMSACYVCNQDIIKLLIANGCVVNALDDHTGDTAAHYITHSLSGTVRQCVCLMLLVEAQANVDLRNNDGYTVNELAEKNGNKDVAMTFEMY